MTNAPELDNISVEVEACSQSTAVKMVGLHGWLNIVVECKAAEIRTCACSSADNASQQWGKVNWRT
jgi:hypothetical protein